VGRVWQHEKGFGGCWSEGTWVERLSATYQSFCASTAFNTSKYTEHTAINYKALPRTPAHCTTLQRTATHSIALLRVLLSTCCNILQHTPTGRDYCNSPQRTATHTRRALRKHLFQLQAAVAYNGHSDADAQKCTSDISQPCRNT